MTLGRTRSCAARAGLTVWTRMSLLTLFDLSLVTRAARPAVQFEDREGRAVEITFGELDARSNRVAQWLRANRVERGGRVAFFLANRIEVIELWIAAVKLGVVLVPINVLYRERELRHIVKDAEPRAVITSRDLAVFLPPGTTVWDVDEVWADAAKQNAARIAVPCDADTPMALIYTSGTTGTSKGAVLTQGNFATNGLALAMGWAIAAEDRYLAALPLFHVHGLANGVHVWLFSGCHMRLFERFEHAKAAAWFDEYRPTLFFGVPAMFVRLLELPAETARAIGSRLRLAVSGSAPLPAEVLEKFRARFGHTILERYGMTETLMNVGNPYASERRAGTVGLPLPHVAVRICDDAGMDVTDGNVGEVWVRGPNVCSGYWRRPDATAAAWRDGWFRTGDIGVRAVDGYITLQGRRSDLIISGGFNIYPREIEEVLLEQPGVREATVVGASDPVRGEVPVGYVVVDSAAYDEAAVRARLATQLASFKLPRALVRVDALPRTALGKVQKHLLPKWSAQP
jgi:malonyl-CoA/methylmalonyl-CoA synthetase